MAGKVCTKKRKYLAENNHQQPVKRLKSSPVNFLLLEAVSKCRQAVVASLLQSSVDQISTKTLDAAIVQASANGHKRLLQHLIRHGANINSRNNKGYTTLMLAAEHGYVDIVKLLVNHGANINSKTKGGKTALILAAEKACFLPVVELLISKYADVNIQDREGRTALMASVEMCDIAGMQVLMYHKEMDFYLRDRKNRTAFDIAKQCGVQEEFITIQECIGKRDLNPLLVAVMKGDVSLLREFLDSDCCNTEHTDAEGYTPLMLALKNVSCDASKDIIMALLQGGADVNSLCRAHGERTPLMYAAELGNLDAARLFVEHGVNVNAQTPGSNLSALMVAAQKGFFDLLEFLLKNGADSSLKDINNNTAFMFAAKNHQISCVDVLIRHGVNLCDEDLILAACMNIDSEQYLTYLPVTRKIAASKVCFMLIERYLGSKNYALVEFLLDHGVDLRKHIKNFFLTAVTRDVHMTKLLLDRGAKLNSVDSFGLSALMKATCCDKKDVIQLLIERGAQLNYSIEGKTALIVAVWKLARNAMEVLLQAGVDVSYIPKHPDSSAPLHHSISLGYNDITEQLINHGADLHSLNTKGETALSLAVKLQNHHLIDLLLAKGVSLDKQAGSGDIPLHAAVTNHDFKTVQKLLKAGADVNATDNAGKTALMICCQMCWTEDVHFLLKNGADVAAADHSGSTALHYALKHSISLTDKTKILLKYGADINVRNKEGHTAFMVAVGFCNNNVLQVLLEHGADMNAQDLHGSSALINSVLMKIERAEFLLGCGVDMNIQNNIGYTALMVAADESNDLAMKALLNAGANIHLLDRRNYNVLSVALAKYNKCQLCFVEDVCKHNLCIEMLIKAGAKPDMSNQCTLALYKAIICNKIKLVQLLVGCGIPPLEMPRDGHDLLNYSVPPKFFIAICGVPCHLPVFAEFLLALNASFHARSPLSTAIFCKNAAICELFIQNEYFNMHDISRRSLHCHNSILANAAGTKLASVCGELLSAPFSLSTQSLMAVRSSISGGRDREQCIRALPIPQFMQEKLLYSNSVNNLSEIPSNSQEVVNFMLP